MVPAWSQIVAIGEDAFSIEGNFRTCLIQTGANCFLRFDFRGDEGVSGGGGGRGGATGGRQSPAGQATSRRFTGRPSNQRRKTGIHAAGPPCGALVAAAGFASECWSGRALGVDRGVAALVPSDPSQPVKHRLGRLEGVARPRRRRAAGGSRKQAEVRRLLVGRPAGPGSSPEHKRGRDTPS